MAITIVPYTPELEGAVARFNRRMREGKAPSSFDLPPRAVAPREGAVRLRQFVAVEGDEVRGGLLILEHPAFMNEGGGGGEGRSEGAGGRRTTVINLQSPLSEAIIDSRYAMVSIQLIRFAVKVCPYAYVVGMGSLDNPLPRLLKASGWSVRPVPFAFHVLRPARCLTQLGPLQRTPLLRFAARAGAHSGAGALALLVAQRGRGSAAGYRAEPLEASSVADAANDDAVWAAVESRLSFGVVRDSSTLAGYLWPQVVRTRVYCGERYCGWFSMLVSSMRDNAYFGNLTVSTLVDLVAADAADLGPMAVLARRGARAAGCDIVVTNQLQREAQDAVRAAGFLSYRSNYLLATSKALSAAMRDETSLVSRQDGDGLVNMRRGAPREE